MTFEEILANSYQDFHTKGFDYLCVKRTPAHTVKLYFFDSEASDLPEVVAPHNHRYSFVTRVLAGSVDNIRYERSGHQGRPGRLYERFDYMTPLNGGDGFTWTDTERLVWYRRDTYRPGSVHSHEPRDVHTIKVNPGTILMLHQYEDELPLDQPTQCWQPVGMRQGPDLSDLYTPMTADRAKDRLLQAIDVGALRYVDEPSLVLKALIR